MRYLQDFILDYDSMIEIIRHTCNQPANASGRSDVTKPNGCQGDGNPVQRIWDGVKPYLAIVTQWVHCFLLRKVNSGCKQNHHRGKDNKYDYQITSNELECGLLRLKQGNVGMFGVRCVGMLKCWNRLECYNVSNPPQIYKLDFSSTWLAVTIPYQHKALAAAVII